MRNPLGIFIALAIFAVLEFYCFIAIQTALRTTNSTTRYSVLAIYVILSLIAWITVFTFKSMHITEWPPLIRMIVVSFIMGFLVAKILVAAFMLLDDFRRLVTWLFRQMTHFFPQAPDGPVANSGISRSTFLARLALLTGGLALSGFMYGTRNRYRYQVKQKRISLPKLPQAFKGLKIVQISDIHAGSFDDPEAVVHGVDLILKEKPDLILFTGDLVNNQAEEMLPYLSVFSRLKAPLGVYSTLGNHDYGDYVSWPSEAAKVANLEQLKQYHADMGWRLLMNEHVLLERAGEKIALLGVENWGAKARFPKHGRLADAYKGLENIPVAVKILMSHDPSHWDAQVRPGYRDIDLTLSGHTHGMQFGLKLPWMKWSPVQYLYKQWDGLYQEEQQYLHVNVGFGFLGYPGRLGILPEITVIELV